MTADIQVSSLKTSPSRAASHNFETLFYSLIVCFLKEIALQYWYLKSRAKEDKGFCFCWEEKNKVIPPEYPPITKVPFPLQGES